MIVQPRATSLTFSTRLAGDFEYADKWDPDLKKASAYLNTWMYVVREYEDATDDCVSRTDDSRGCNEVSAASAINAWEKAVAFRVGSIEGTEGNSKEGNYGTLLCALAERRCINFKTYCLTTPYPLAN